MPHRGKWDDTQISTETVNWNEPLIASFPAGAEKKNISLVEVTGSGLQVTAVLIDGNDLLVRLFNAEGDNKNKKIMIGGNAEAAELEELNGNVKETLKIQKVQSNTLLNISMPRFGIRTIRLKRFKAF